MSKKLGFTVQETSRNVSRLVEAKLIEKDSDSRFSLTPYGEETLVLLEGLSFLSKYREYFASHTLSVLPKEFSSSIALLRDCELVEDVMVAFSNVESMIQNAEKYIWIISNQILVSTLPYLQEAVRRGVEFKLLFPKDVVPPKGASKRMNAPVFFEAVKSGKLEIRSLDKIDVFSCLSDKEVGALGFLNIDGKMNYHGFHSTDESSCKWTKALFLHYWDSAIRQTPEFL
jgi:predicted transcriptional regulator